MADGKNKQGRKSGGKQGREGGANKPIGNQKSGVNRRVRGTWKQTKQSHDMNMQLTRALTECMSTQNMT